MTAIMYDPTTGEDQQAQSRRLPQPYGLQQPGQPQAGYPGTQQFTATDNLRGTQVNPTVNPQQQQATSSATDAYGRARTSIGDTTATSGAATGARAMAMSDLANLSGPDRGQIAQDVFGQIRDATEPQFQKDLQGVGRKAAALGRLGAGMTTSELGDVMSTRERDLSLAQRGLASEAAGQTLSDRLGVFDARLAGSGQFTQEDLGRAGFGLSKASAEQGLGSRYQDLASQLYGQERGERDELRGERAYQGELQQQSTDDYIRQRQLEEMLLQGEYDRDMGYTDRLLAYGYGG